jgi:hypothetical protein
MRLTAYRRYTDFALMSLRLNVGYGSKADIRAAIIHVRFTPQRRTLAVQNEMSAMGQ